MIGSAKGDEPDGSERCKARSGVRLTPGSNLSSVICHLSSAKRPTLAIGYWLSAILEAPTLRDSLPATAGAKGERARYHRTREQNVN